MWATVGGLISIPFRDALPSAGTKLLPSLEPLLVNVEGRVRELDKDRLSFELREIQGPVKTQRFVFGEELLEDVFQAARKTCGFEWPDDLFPSRMWRMPWHCRAAVGTQSIASDPDAVWGYASAFNGTDGSSATWTHVCTCGRPRKCQTKAGPSIRQISYSPAMSWPFS